MIIGDSLIHELIKIHELTTIRSDTIKSDLIKNESIEKQRVNIILYDGTKIE